MRIGSVTSDNPAIVSTISDDKLSGTIVIDKYANYNIVFKDMDGQEVKTIEIISKFGGKVSDNYIGERVNDNYRI